MTLFVVGVGASGEGARDLVDDGIDGIASHPLITLRAWSRRYRNPAWGGATRAPFVNAAVVVDTVLVPSALLQALFTVERRCGRVRPESSAGSGAHKNGARTLDLDVLWSPSATSRLAPVLPHPRFFDRSFAVLPALEALDHAAVVVPIALREAGRRHALAPLVALT